MKQLLLLFCCIGFLSVKAQLPIVNSLSVCPSPTSSTHTYLISNSSFSSGSCLLNTQSIILSGDTIYIEASYCQGLLLFVCTRLDTFDLGVLPAGQYTAKVRVHGIGYDFSGNCLIPMGSSPFAYHTFSVVDSIAAMPVGIDTIVCGGEPVSILGGNECWNYLWQDGSQDPIYVANAPGTYIVTASDPFGNVVYTDTTIVSWLAGPTVELGSDTLICAQDTLWLSAGNPGASYLWQDSSINDQIGVTMPGLYHVQITDGKGCTTTDSIEVDFQSLPPMVSLEDSITICVGDSAILNAGPDSLAYSYLWSTGDSSTQIHVFDSGAYDVSLIDSLGCTSTSNDVIVLLKDCTTNLEELSNWLSFSVSPNPTDRYTRVQMPRYTGRNISWRLFDLMGKQIRSGQSDSNMFQLDLHSVPSGVYLLWVHDGKYRQGSQKILLN